MGAGPSRRGKTRRWLGPPAGEGSGAFGVGRKKGLTGGARWLAAQGGADPRGRERRRKREKWGGARPAGWLACSPLSLFFLFSLFPHPFSF